MTSVTDPKMSNIFTSEIMEIHNKRLKEYGEVIDATTELCQSHRHFVKSSIDLCTKKCKDDEMLFETIHTFKKDLKQKNATLKEKQHAISEVMSEIQQMEMQKDDIIQKIESLKEEHAERRDVIESQNKANKDKLKNLGKARLIFQEHLGMEIRRIGDKTQGENLQFVFRNINPSDQDSAYVITMGIKADGTYQIVSSDPALECLPVLESRLQETNNLAAFLGNIRKEFIAKARC